MMLVINTTFFVAESHLNMFLKWLRETYIPNMVSTGQFSAHHFFKVLAEGEPGTVSYSLQFEFSDLSVQQQWDEIYLYQLQHELKMLFDDNVLSFSTLLQKL